MARPGVHPLSSRVVSKGSISGSAMTGAFRSAVTAAGHGRIVTSKRGGTSEHVATKLIPPGKS